MENLLLIFFLICCAIETRVAFWLFKGIQRKESHDWQHTVSVIIAARNEAKHLPKLLEELKKKQHPSFEVILVDDRSADETQEILTKYGSERWLITLRVDQLPNGWNGKKYAIQQAVLRAKNDILLFTDADCFPSSQQWISSFSAAFDPKTEIVLGYSPYQKERGVLNQLIQFDTLYTGLQYLGFTRKSKPYMAVGRNWAVRRSSYPLQALEEAKTITGGDDDLIMQSIATPKNAKALTDKESFVLSAPHTSWASFIDQKVRHTAVGLKYT